MQRQAYPIYTQWLDREKWGEEYEDFFLETQIMGFHTRVIGLDSRIPDLPGYPVSDNAIPRHIFMLDTMPLDKLQYETMVASITAHCLREGYIGLIVRSSHRESDINSYHVYMPHAFTVYEIRDMTFCYRYYADMLFYGLGAKRKFWDLRISSKGTGTGDSPTLMKYIIPSSVTRAISMAHWEVLNRFLKPIPTLPNDAVRYPFIYNEASVNKILLRYLVRP